MLFYSYYTVKKSYFCFYSIINSVTNYREAILRRPRVSKIAWSFPDRNIGVKIIPKRLCSTFEEKKIAANYSKSAFFSSSFSFDFYVYCSKHDRNTNLKICKNIRTKAAGELHSSGFEQQLVFTGWFFLLVLPKFGYVQIPL